MLTAKDIMARKLATVRPDASITEAILLLLERNISGVPVVSAEGELVGILSERDCLRVIAVGEYSEVDRERTRSVAEFMSPPHYTVSPETGIYSLADFFLTHHQRRLPVVRDGKLVGLVSRRDVLGGIEEMIRKGQLPTPTTSRSPQLYPSAVDTPADVIGKRLS